MNERRGSLAWLYDDLLAWLTPGGLLVTALALRFPQGLKLLRDQAPELLLPTWFAAAYALGLALSPIGRIIYAIAQAIVWPRLRNVWTPAITCRSASSGPKGSRFPIQLPCLCSSSMISTAGCASTWRPLTLHPEKRFTG